MNGDVVLVFGVLLFMSIGLMTVGWAGTRVVEEGIKDVSRWWAHRKCEKVTLAEFDWWSETTLRSDAGGHNTWPPKRNDWPPRLLTEDGHPRCPHCGGLVWSGNMEPGTDVP